jgi:hypothetical protein
MAVHHKVRPDEVGRSLGVELARAGGVVEGLWMTATRGVLTFWILTRPIDFAMQQTLYERTIVLYDKFPGVEFTVHILNPGLFSGDDPLAVLPPEAQQLSLSAA